VRVVVFALLLMSAALVAQETGALVAGCPRTSQEFYRCAKPKAAAFTPPRTADGKPDMQGAWNASTTTGSQNIEEHPGDNGFFYRATKTLVVDPADGRVPYQPWALAQRAKHLEHYIDPFATCYPSGIPRQIYAPRGHHFLQSPGRFVVVSEWAHVSRVIRIDGSPHPGPNIRLYMGDSRGRWEGNTLVVDTTNLTDETWLDVVGDFHSEALHVVERLTMMDRDTILYEATLDDPKVFTRPWTMAFPLMRMEPGHEVMEEACYEGDRSLPNLLSTGYRIYTGLAETK
jgi:hypothetical protein